MVSCEARILWIPSADAPSTSAWKLARVLSRPVICSTGSRPFCIDMMEQASDESRAVAEGLSVKLAASMLPLSDSTFLIRSSGLAERGGMISAVRAIFPEASTLSRCETGSCTGAGCGNPSPPHQAGWRISRKNLSQASMVRLRPCQSTFQSVFTPPISRKRSWRSFTAEVPTCPSQGEEVPPSSGRTAHALTRSKCGTRCRGGSRPRSSVRGWNRRRVRCADPLGIPWGK